MENILQRADFELCVCFPTAIESRRESSILFPFNSSPTRVSQ